MEKEVVVFQNAVKEHVPMLIKATNLKEDELNSRLVSFAYETKQMLEKSRQSLVGLDAQSIREAFKASIDTGIPVDKRQLAYVIKYGNSLQYHIGFKGFIHRIKEIYPNSSIKAELVYAGDVFEVEKVDGQARYKHKMANPFATIQQMTGAYAYIQYTENGKEYSFIETMGKAEIDKIRSKAKTGMVWNDWYGEMAKKAVIRRLCKTLFVGNPKINVLEEVDNKNFEMRQEPIQVDYSKTIDMPEEITPNKAEVIEAQEQVVEQEIKEDTATEVVEQQEVKEAVLRTIESVGVKKGKTKTGKDWTLYVLQMLDGSVIKTFDEHDYQKGQDVQLVDFDEAKGQAKKVIIL